MRVSHRHHSVSYQLKAQALVVRRLIHYKNKNTHSNNNITIQTPNQYNRAHIYNLHAVVSVSTSISHTHRSFCLLWRLQATYLPSCSPCRSHSIWCFPVSDSCWRTPCDQTQTHCWSLQAQDREKTFEHQHLRPARVSGGFDQRRFLKVKYVAEHTVRFLLISLFASFQYRICVFVGLRGLSHYFKSLWQH